MDLLSLEHFSGCLNETFSADLQGMQAAEFLRTRFAAHP